MKYRYYAFQNFCVSDTAAEVFVTGMLFAKDDRHDYHYLHEVSRVDAQGQKSILADPETLQIPQLRIATDGKNIIGTGFYDDRPSSGFQFTRNTNPLATREYTGIATVRIDWEKESAHFMYVPFPENFLRQKFRKHESTGFPRPSAGPGHLLPEPGRAG